MVSFSRTHGRNGTLMSKAATVFFCMCISLTWAFSLHADTDVFAARDEVALHADNITWVRDNVVHAEGNVVVRYQDLTIRADNITYDYTSGVLESPDWIHMTYNMFEVVAERAIYNVHTGAGQFDNAHAAVDFGPFRYEGRWYERKWYTYGERVTKDPGTLTFHVKDARATTTPPEYRQPLYHIEAKTLTIMPPDPDDPYAQARIVARNCALKFENIPIFWLPEITYTLRDDDDQSPIQLTAGYSSSLGAFARGAIDILRTENVRLTPHVGYYSKHGVAFGVDGNYYARYTNVTVAAGRWKTFFLEDMSRKFIQGKPRSGEKKGDRMWRYRFLWEHTQEFGPGAGWLAGGRLLADVDWLSDPDIMHQFYRSEYRRHGPRDTWIDFTLPIGADNEVSIYAVKQINNFYTTYERLPELRHVFRKRQILDIPALNIPVYYESRSRAGYYRYLESDLLEDRSRFSLWRAWTDQKLTMPNRFFGFLNVTPFLGIASEFGHMSEYRYGESAVINPMIRPQRRVSETTRRFPASAWLMDYNRITRVPLTVFHEQKEGAFFHILPYAGVDMNFKTHRTYNFEGTYLGELIQQYLSSDNQQIRHIIEPKSRLFGTTGFGTDSGAAMGFDVGLRNAFQTERRGRNVNLLDFTVFQSTRAAGGFFRGPRHTTRNQYLYARRVRRTRNLRRRVRYNVYQQSREVNRYYQPRYAAGIDATASPTEWLTLESDFVWDMDEINRITRATLNANIDTTWMIQRLFANPYMPRNLRGRKDEMIATIGYRYLYDQSNLITVGNRFWFDDFNPLLSERMQQKDWARELARGWGFEYNLRFESHSGILQQMEYTIYKNWKKTLDTGITYRMDEGDHSIYASFWLTAYPQAKLDLGN